MSKKAQALVESAVMPIVEDMGYEYVGTEVKKIASETELIIYADKVDGLGLDDCEKISRTIDPIIEQIDPIEDGYYLCVSSPGLDRPLDTKRDFERSIGKKVDIKLYKAVEKKKNFIGELKSFDDEGFTIGNELGQTYYLYKDTAIVRLHVDI